MKIWFFQNFTMTYHFDWDFENYNKNWKQNW
jgi:hypothetical protein